MFCLVVCVGTCACLRRAKSVALVSRLSHIFMDTVSKEGKILHPYSKGAFKVIFTPNPVKLREARVQNV